MTTTTTIDVFFLFFHFHSRSPYQLGSPREPPGLCFTATSTIAVVGRGRRGRRRAPALYLLLLVLFPLVLFRGRAVAAHCGKKRTKRKSERRAERRKETNASSKQNSCFPSPRTRNSSAPARRLSLGSTLLDNARDLPPARQRQQGRRFSLRRAYAENRKPSID
jgi:hypothetical protein